jgi:Ubiquitin 3 binding protein But2 C-terminal domain
MDMKPITLITSILLGCVIANPTPQPWDRKHHNPWKHTDQGCPANGTLQGNYFGVDGLVPVSSSQPTVEFGFSNSAIINPNDYCTIFNLIVPPSGLGKTCTLEFLLPDTCQAGYNYTFAGAGHFTFTGYAFGTGATEDTTFQNQPPPGSSPPMPPTVLTPGNAYVINVGPCGIQSGMPGLEVSEVLCSSDTTFVYQQSRQAKCPIGFYVTIT